MKGKVKARVRTDGTTEIQKGNPKTLVRLYEAGTTKCNNKPQDSVCQQKPCLFLEYINCISLMPHTSEERYIPCKEKAHRKVPGQWNSSSGVFSFFISFFTPPPALHPGVGDCSKVRGCAAWREYPLLHHTAAYKESLLLQNKSGVWGETKRYLCITMAWACYCGSQMADPSTQLPPTSSWKNPSHTLLSHTSHSWRHLASSFLMV